MNMGSVLFSTSRGFGDCRVRGGPGIFHSPFSSDRSRNPSNNDGDTDDLVFFSVVLRHTRDSVYFTQRSPDVVVTYLLVCTLSYSYESSLIMVDDYPPIDLKERIIVR